MIRTTRLGLTAGLTLAAALTVGGAAFAAQDVPSDDGTRFVAVQDPAPGQPRTPGDRDCPWHRGGSGPGAAPSVAPSAPAPAPAASTA